MSYTALGLSDSGNVELEDHKTEQETRTFIEGYTRQGNWGGYYGIAIINPEGEYLDVIEPVVLYPIT